MSSSGEKRRRLSLKSPDIEVSDDRKNPSQRPFSEEDEIRLLNAFLKISKTAKSSPSPVKTASSLFDRIGETLSCDVSQTLLMKKLRRLRRKYSKQINKKSRSMKMKTPHERNVFQICQEIWGGEESEEEEEKRSSSRSAEERSPSVCVNNQRENSGTLTDDPVAEMAAPEYVPVPMEEASRLPRGLGKSDLKRKGKSEEQAEERSPSICVNNRRENSETLTDDPVAEMAAPEYVPVPMEEASRLPRGLGKSDLKRKKKSEEQEEKRSSSRSAEERSPSVCVNNRRENSETLTDDPVAEIAAPEYVPVPMEEASRLPRGLGKSDLKRKEKSEEQEDKRSSSRSAEEPSGSETLTDDPVEKMAVKYVPVRMEEASRLPGRLVMIEGLKLLGKSYLKGLNARWRLQRIAEAEILLKRAELIQEQGKLIMEAFVSSSHK